MPIAETAKLVASLELQDKFSKNAAVAEKSIGRLEKKSAGLSKIGKQTKEGLGAAAKNLKTIGVVAAGAIASQVALGVQSLAELEQVKNQTAAVIKATKSVANVTAEQVRAQAEELENLSTVDDKVIQAGENMLLTFKNIRNETGKGNDIFNQATKTLLDLSVAMGTEPKQAAIQLGKALNDPIKGITALTRVGVTFTEKQQDEIKALVKAGDTMKAQKIILRELNSEFGGSAAAFGQGPGAALRRFGDAVEGMQQALATGFLPLIEKVSGKVQTLFSDPKVLRSIERFGTKAAGALDDLIGIAEDLPWGSIGDAFRIMGTGARIAMDAFKAAPPWLQTAVVTSWGLNKLLGGAPVKIAFELAKSSVEAIGRNIFSRGSTPLNPMFVEDVTSQDIPGIDISGKVPTGGGGGGGVLDTVLKAAALLAARAVPVAAAVSLVGPAERPADPADIGRNEALAKFGQARTAAEKELVSQLRAVGQKMQSASGDQYVALQAQQRTLEDQLIAIRRSGDAAAAGRRITDGILAHGASEHNRVIRQAMKDSSSRITRQIVGHAASERSDFRTLHAIDRQVSSKTAQAVERMRGVESASRETTGVLRRKNFSPKIDVEANFEARITVNSVTRRVVQMQRAAGRGFTSTGLIQ